MYFGKIWRVIVSRIYSTNSKFKRKTNISKYKFPSQEEHAWKRRVCTIRSCRVTDNKYSSEIAWLKWIYSKRSKWWKEGLFEVFFDWNERQISLRKAKAFADSEIIVIKINAARLVKVGSFKNYYFTMGVEYWKIVRTQIFSCRFINNRNTC